MGDTLVFAVGIVDPAQNLVAQPSKGSNTPSIESGIVSATGNYTIKTHNSGNEFSFAEEPSRNYSGRGIGLYTLYIGCTLRDGTVINPGDTQVTSSISSQQQNVPTFTGYGFPGLAPVSFDSIAKIPMPAGLAMSGAVTPTGSEIIGYTLSASAGNTLNLGFTRLSGNLNLGLVLIHDQNQIVYQTSLVTAQIQNTAMTLPFDGEYTIAIFRMDLLPPDNPQATAFQIQADVK